MSKIHLKSFGGQIPAVDDTLLPEINASLAENTWLYSGIIDPIKQFKTIRSLTNSLATKVYRIPRSRFEKQNLFDSYWLEFVDPDTDVVRSPITNDTFERYYFTSTSTGPLYNPLTRIAQGLSALTLGVTAPSSAPSLVVGGGAGTTVTRAYVTTWSTAYGEEGPPSPAVTVTGFVNGSWNLTIPLPLAADTTGRNLQTVNIYRAVTSASGIGTFYKVASLPIATTSYPDTIPDATVTANTQLQSTNWSAPPSDLRGFCELPNGMIAGFRSNEVWYCEPYRPHAWPAIYTQTIASPIVGLAATGQSLVVCTAGYPYVMTGISPANVTVSKLETLEPCASRGSIAATATGVFYASANGLVAVTPGRAIVVTASVVTKDKWLDNLSVPTLRAAALNTSYYAWGSVRKGVFSDTAFSSAFETFDYGGSFSGVILDTDIRLAYTTLTSLTPIQSVHTDIWTGEILLVRNRQIMWFDTSVSAVRGTCKWRSKKFQEPFKVNYSAMKIFFTVPFGTPPQNATPNTGPNTELQTGQYAIVRVYADDRLVMSREVRTSGEQMRMPSGFKADYWQVEVETRVSIRSIQMATSPKELSAA